MGFSRQEYWSGVPLPSPKTVHIVKKKKKNTAFFKTIWQNITFSSVQFSLSVVSYSLRPDGLQHTRPPCLSPTPRVHPNPCPLSWWYHPTILSSVFPFSSCPQSFPASGSFQMSQLFASGGQSTGVSASTSVLSMNTQDWSNITLNRYKFGKFSVELVLPSQSPLLQSIQRYPSSPLAQGGFPSVRNIFLLHDSLPSLRAQAHIPYPALSWNSLSPFMSLSFALPFSKEIGLHFLEVWGLLEFRSCSVGFVPCSDEFLVSVGRQAISSSYSSVILRTSPKILYW